MKHTHQGVAWRRGCSVRRVVDELECHHVAPGNANKVNKFINILWFLCFLTEMYLKAGSHQISSQNVRKVATVST